MAPELEKNAQDNERRTERHKKRVRTQIFAYVAVVLAIAVLAGAIVAGLKVLTSMNKEDPGQQSKEQQDKVEDIFKSEESLSVPETEPQPETQEPTYEEKLDSLIDELIGQMSLEDKVAGLFFVSPESITGVSTAIQAGDATKEALVKYPVGGIVYEGKNIQSEEQLRELLQKTGAFAEESANHNIFLAVSEEGGDNSPVAAAGLGSETSSAGEIGASNDPQGAYEAGNTIGNYLKELGFNFDFAPVADLNLVDNSALGNRSYGSDAVQVSEYVAKMIQGLSDSGAISCVIQFPGTGSTTLRTQDGLVSSDRSEQDFRENEFVVFQAAINAGAPAVMVSNISVPSLDESNVPCSMSEKVVTQILRREMGFNGIIISEAMNRKAISDYYSADEAAVDALKAGCDMILLPEDFEKAYEGVLQAVGDGRISDERINDSLKRVYRIKYADKVE